MAKKYLCIVFLLFGIQLNAQNNKIPNLKVCSENENASCSYFTIHNLIKEQLNTLHLSTDNKAPNEIIISSVLKFDASGKIDPSSSVFYSKNIAIEEELDVIIKDIPNINPKTNSKGEFIASYYRNTFYFNHSDSSFSTWENTKPKESDFFVPEKVPVYPGCKVKWSNQKLRKCMSQSISRYITTSFNSSGALNKANVLPGNSVKIITSFIIDKSGKITDIKAQTNYKSLENEAINVLQRISVMDRPGNIGHKAINVPYRLPIILTVPF